MRLFSNKHTAPSTSISRDVATSPRYPLSPLWCKSPKHAREREWDDYVKGDGQSQTAASRSSLSQSESEEPPEETAPYDLNRVPTAQGYNSDDSDEELEKAPSRYDLTDGQQDDLGWDDMSNDRYSQVAKRLAIMSDDSDSIRAMWRSFDDYDDYPDEPLVEEEADPFLINPEDEDWEDTRGEETPSLMGRRNGPVRERARTMASMVDDDDLEEDDIDEVESHYDDGSSQSSTLNTVEEDPADFQDEEQDEEQPEDRRNHFEDNGKSTDDRRKSIDDRIRQPDDRIRQPDDRIKQPDDRRKQPEEKRKQPEETRKQPEEKRKQPEDKRTQPEDKRTQPEDKRTQPEQGRQDNQKPPPKARRVKLMEQKQVSAKPPLASQESASPSSSKMPASQVQAEIIQKVTEELQSKKQSDQEIAKLKAAAKQRNAKPSREKQSKGGTSRRKQASPRGFGLFRRNSKKSLKPQPSAKQPEEEQTPPKPIPQKAHKEKRESVVEPSDELEDYLEDLDSNEQHLSVPAHTSKMAPRGILKSSSFSVAQRTVETTADSSNPATTVVDADICDEEDRFCGLFSNAADTEMIDEIARDKTEDETKSEAPTEQSQETHGCNQRAPSCNEGTQPYHEKSQAYFAEMCSNNNDPKDADPKDTANGAAITTDDRALALMESRDDTDDPISENRSVSDGNVDSTYMSEYDQNEPILVTCLRDNYCPVAASSLLYGVRKADALSCQQNYQFLDEALQAENPKADPAVAGGNSVVEVETKALALDDKTKRRKRSKPKRQGNGGDAFYDELPIKTIEIPSSVILDNVSVTASCSTLGGRKKTGLFVDTQLEQDMQQMQAELDGNEGKKKKSLFGRMKRASQHKQKKNKEEY